MTTVELSQVATFIVVCLSAALSAYNSWQNKQISLSMAEMQLNMRREMNGRYVAIDRFNDFKEYVKDLEARHKE